MNKEEIIEKIIPVFRTVFEDENLEIDEKSNSDNVNGWDSLNHINLVSAIEKEFNIRFALGELQTLKDVGAMIDLMEEKLK